MDRKKLYTSKIINAKRGGRNTFKLSINCGSILKEVLSLSEAEYIVWKCETLEQVREKHPKWNDEQVRKYYSAVNAILERKGFFK